MTRARKNAQRKSHTRTLRVMLAGFVAVGAMVLLYPFIPLILYYLGIEGKPDPARIASTLVPEGEERKDFNHLVIPKIGVSVPIVEGSSEAALDRGAWRIPETSTPEVGGNTVISAHRFRFLPPNNTTFYLLDKLEVGDEITVFWKGERYDYQVGESSVVDKSAVVIQEEKGDTRLTLFTCTPLFSTAQRLAIVAFPVDKGEIVQ
ncbi:MAG: sortase [bacterium]|nr:sortase [bacterium]